MVTRILELFPQYHALVKKLREEADRAMDLQDQNLALAEQNIKLVDETREARAQAEHALKSVANVFAQLAGHIPPYREAYTIEKKPDRGTTGPIATSRMNPRDLVNKGIKDFKSQLYGSTIEFDEQAAEAMMADES